MILSSHLGLASLPNLDRPASLKPFLIFHAYYKKLPQIGIYSDYRIKKKFDGVFTRILARVLHRRFSLYWL